MGGHKISPNPTLLERYPDSYLGMGLTAELVAKKYGIDREKSDAFALASHQKALAAIEAGKFKDEIVPLTVSVPNGDGKPKSCLRRRRGPAPRTRAPQALAKLKPALSPQGHRDRGQRVADVRRRRGRRRDVAASARRSWASSRSRRFVTYAVAGVPPEIMGIGPVEAIPKALKQAGLKLADIDLIELNEAFACQALAVIEAAGPRSREGERERRRGRARPSARLHRRQAHRADPGRDGAAQGPLRARHDVRGRRHGRRRNLREDVERMATETKAAGRRRARRQLPDRGPHARRRSSRPRTSRDEQRMIGETAADFMEKEVAAAAPRDPDAQVRGHARAAAQGGRAGPARHRDPRGVRRPRPRQGLGLHRLREARRATAASPSRTWATPASARCPIVYFGTDGAEEEVPAEARERRVDQLATRSRRRARPRDAMNAKARAVLSPDGKSWILNGEKMWLTNAGFADVYITFAKVDGEHFTAFIIEKGTPGRQPRRRGEEDRHQGLAPRGRSSCRTRVIPKENLLGEIGKGAQDRVQHPQHRALQAGRGRHRRRQARDRAGRRVRQESRTAFGQSDHRLRPRPRTSSARWRSAPTCPSRWSTAPPA